MRYETLRPRSTPNAARIRIALAQKGFEHLVEFVTVDLIAAEQKQPGFLALNPVGKTPVLVLDDGFAISESTAITEYFDNLDGDPVLTGRTPREKAAIRMMQRRVEMMLTEPVDDYFHYGTPGLRSGATSLAQARLASCAGLGRAARGFGRPWPICRGSTNSLAASHL